MASAMSVLDDFADAPAWLAETVSRRFARDAQAGVAIVEVDTPWAIERATKFLLEEAPIATEGDGGDATTNRIVNRVGDFGVSPSVCLDLMQEHWDWRCIPPWEDQLKTKIISGYKSRQNPIGCAHPDAKARDFDVIVPAPAPGASELLEFEADTDEAALIEESTNYVVDEIIYRGDTSACYGPSTAGKTFVILDLSYHVALGKEWHGLKVKQGAVLYVTLEGLRGFRYRMKAAKRVHGAPGKNFAILRPRITLTADEAGQQGVAQIVQAAETLQKESGNQCVMIVLDTYARVNPGADENSAGEIMAFIERRMGEIAARTGAHVHVVHHSGKNGDIRGSSAFKPSFETLLRIDREEDSKTRTVIAEKLKDSEERPLFDCELEIVALGQNSEGKTVTSCVVKQVPFRSEAMRKEEKLRGLADWMRPLIASAIEGNVALSTSPRAPNYLATWLHRQLVPGSEVEKKDIEAAYGRFLYGVEFEHREEKDRNDRPVVRIVRKS